ncbi:cyclophilin-like protein [Lipomyces oligophaga]|uniref:cyclophilin-like protein n=1 Tax=Lipomyces oligophaga TaxID=45792 RepID=UPI0034CF2451
MSSALEPPTTAKVVLHTTKGPIEIELWAKETPKACRNFLQHCLDGYYDNNLFHRVVPGFLVQTGDPTGTGHGGVSIYHDENGAGTGGFPSEYHSRLRFNRRGLLGNAEAENLNDNSQFFITLDATPELQRKNTLFGRVMGDTIYNVLKIGESELDRDDRPLYPAKIMRTEILVNYFSDMVSHAQPTIAEDSTNKKTSAKHKKRKTRPKIKMSFGDEAEEDLAVLPKFKMKSAHEILNDSRLSNAIPQTPPEKKQIDLKPVTPLRLPFTTKQSTEQTAVQPSNALHSNESKLESRVSETAKKEDQTESFDQVAEKPSEFDKINAEIEAMKESLKRRHERTESEPSNIKKTKRISALELEREKYLESKTALVGRRKFHKRTKADRELETLALLSKFTDKLHAATAPPIPSKSVKRGLSSSEISVDESLCELHNLPHCESCMYYDRLSEGEDDTLDTIMTHTFTDPLSRRRRTAEFEETLVTVPPPPPPPRRHRRRQE